MKKNKRFLIFFSVAVIILTLIIVGIRFKNNFCKHNNIEKIYTEATCELDGSIVSKCKDCNKIINSTSLNKLEHFFKFYSIDASCNSEGYFDREICYYCGYVKNPGSSLPKLEHSKVIIPYKSPTCLEDGHKEYTMCTVCNETLTEKIVIPATGHGLLINDNGKKPTCVNEGITSGSYCSVCNSYVNDREIIPALGHNLTSNYCNRCDLKIYNNVTDFLADCDSNFYSKSYARIEIRLSESINNKSIIFSETLNYVKLIGDENVTYSNVSFKFIGINPKYVVLDNVKIKNEGTVFIADNSLFMYAVNGENDFIVTGTGKNGSNGYTPLFGDGTNGETGGKGASCIIVPMCYIYTLGGNIYIKGGKGGTGGEGGAACGLWNEGGNGGNGGTGGYAIEGYAYKNISNINDLYSFEYFGSGWITLSGGDGGNGGMHGLGGGKNGETGAKGLDSLN